jgi:hypothetical protein
MENTSSNQKQSGAFAAMRAVFFSFIGVRSKSEYQADITRLTMGQLVVAGIVGAILFVLTLVALVYFVTR